MLYTNSCHNVYIMPFLSLAQNEKNHNLTRNKTTKIPQKLKKQAQNAAI